MLLIIYTLYQKHILEVGFGFSDTHQLLDSPSIRQCLCLQQKRGQFPKHCIFGIKYTDGLQKAFKN